MMHDFRHKMDLRLQICTIKMKMTQSLVASTDTYVPLKAQWRPQIVHKFFAII